MIKKLLASVAIAGAAMGAGAVSAAAPNCIGTTVSGNAQMYHPYGQVILVPNTPTNDLGTVGDALAAIRAGQVDDSIYPNTCN